VNFADHDRPRPKLSIAPLIDVVFLLLIFFMLTSSFIQRSAIDLSIPSNKTQAAPSGDPLVVDIGLSGRLALNGLEISLPQLTTELSARADGNLTRTVTVRSKSAVPVQDLVSVMDRIRATGFKNIRLATPGGG
jgi:biopolymer transport protein ExbD